MTKEQVANHLPLLGGISQSLIFPESKHFFKESMEFILVTSCLQTKKSAAQVLLFLYLEKIT